MTPPLVSFVAPSGTGKTTLLEGVIAELRSRGLRVGVLKHDAHRLELDKPGKDTWRFRQAGAWRAVIAGEQQLAVFSGTSGDCSLMELVDRFLSEADIVLTEGFRRADLPTIRVHRSAREPDPDWTLRRQPIAWASDVPIQVDVPVLSLGDPAQVADFLEQTFLRAGPHNQTLTLMCFGSAAQAVDQLAVLREQASEVDAKVLQICGYGESKLSANSIPCLHANGGSLAALLTGLAAVTTSHLAFLGTHPELYAASILRRLVEVSSPRADAVVLEGEVPAQGTGLYAASCLSAVHSALRSGELSIDGWFGLLRVRRLALSQEK